ncbi:MAG: hypothetical protein JW795_10915 [Chitinivibrionales bacterium]|nr:hypothetical protein [Chitinivibrionales bacterium]
MTAIILLIILSIGSIATMSFVMKDKENGSMLAASTQSFYAAEAGIIEAAEILRAKTPTEFHEAVLASNPIVQNLPIGNSNVMVTMNSGYNSPQIARGNKLVNEATHLGAIMTTKGQDVRIKCLGSMVQPIVNGVILDRIVPVYASYSTDSGRTYSSLFPDRYNQNQTIATNLEKVFSVDTIKKTVVIKLQTNQMTSCLSVS